MTFRVIDIVDTSAWTLTASTVPENDHAAWASGTTYARGDRVISTTTHRIYECARDGNQGKNPTLKRNRFDEDTGSGWWLEVGATNRWLVLDGRLTNRAAQATSMQWTINVTTAFNAVAVLNLSAGQVQCEVLNGGTVVSSSTINLGLSTQAQRRAVFLNLTGTAGRSVRITVSGTGVQYAGEIVIGGIMSLGNALHGSGHGFASYSKNEENEYGDPSVIRRKRGARAQVQATCDDTDVERILRVLDNQDARPAVFIAGDPNATNGIVVYGYAEAPFITLSEPGIAEYVLDLKGIT